MSFDPAVELGPEPKAGWSGAKLADKPSVLEITDGYTLESCEPSPNIGRSGAVPYDLSTEQELAVRS